MNQKNYWVNRDNKWHELVYFDPETIQNKGTIYYKEYVNAKADVTIRIVSEYVKKDFDYISEEEIKTKHPEYLV